MEKSQDASGVCGVGPAESTGKPRSRYCPGGMRALSSLFGRRQWNAREINPSLMSSPPDITSATRASSFCSTCSFFDLARPADVLALERLLNQGINYSDIAAQFLW